MSGRAQYDPPFGAGRWAVGECSISESSLCAVLMCACFPGTFTQQ